MGVPEGAFIPKGHLSTDRVGAELEAQEVRLETGWCLVPGTLMALEALEPVCRAAASGLDAGAACTARLTAILGFMMLV